MAIAACGDDDAGIVDAGVGDDAGDVTPLAMAEFCDARETAFCAVQGTCTFCDDLADGPVSFFRRNCERSVQAVIDGRLTYNGRTAARCVTAVGASMCSEAAGPGRILQTEPCPSVFEGAVAPGQACAFSGANECRGGYCDAPDGCPGECVAYQGLDEACDDADLRCDPEFVCEEARCKRRLPEGQTCTLAPGACATGSSCQLVDSGGRMECMKQGNVGDACTTHGSCAYPLACDGARCQTTVDDGEPCRDANNCGAGRACFSLADETPATCRVRLELGDVCVGGGCPVDAQCADDQTGERRCRARASAGESCDYVNCEDELRCIYGEQGGVCRAPFPLDADCTNGYDCASSICRGGRCAEAGAVGAECNLYEGAIGCAEDLYCKTSAPDVGEGTCHAFERAGGDCQATSYGWVVCAAGFFCQCDLPSQDQCNQTPGHLTCVALLADGSDCDGHTQCASDTCIAGTCKDPDELTAVERACIQTN